jgi:hypothetical protein
MRRSVHALEAYKPDSGEMFFNSAGELNAGSNKDALTILSKLLKGVEDGSLSFDVAATEAANDNRKRRSLEWRKERFDRFHAAYKDKASTEWADMGAAICGTLNRTQERLGFMRNFLIRGDLQPGERPKFRRKDRSNVHAVISTDYSAIAPIFCQDDIIEGFEVSISENVRVLEREINRGNIDLVEDVYIRAQQGVSVREDQLFMRQCRIAAGLQSPVLSSPNMMAVTSPGITPNILGQGRAAMDMAAVPVNTMIIGTQVWPDFLTSNFNGAINPVHNYELISTGRIARMLDMDIITDGLRPIGLRVLYPYEVMLLSAPDFLGGYTDRGPVTATPRDNFDDGQPARGWYMYEFISIILANSAAVYLFVRTY